MPWRSATCQMVSPGRASTSLPLRVNLIESLIVLSRNPALLTNNVLAEMFQHHFQRVGGGLAEAANRGVGHGAAELLQESLVPNLLRHQLRRLLGADPARRALAAALVLEESHQVEGGVL